MGLIFQSWDHVRTVGRKLISGTSDWDQTFRQRRDYTHHQLVQFTTQKGDTAGNYVRWSITNKSLYLCKTIGIELLGPPHFSPSLSPSLTKTEGTRTRPYFWTSLIKTYRGSLLVVLLTKEVIQSFH